MRARRGSILESLRQHQTTTKRKRRITDATPQFLVVSKIDVVHNNCKNSIGGAAVVFTKSTSNMKFSALLATAACLFTVGTSTAFIVAPTRSSSRSTALNGLFDRFTAGGSASKEELDEQWEAQQEILRNRRKPAAERDAYFKSVEKRRQEASVKQKNMWAWQTKTYQKGEDPIDEWRKRREDGSISDLDNQYGDPKKIGGIPLPGASFGVSALIDI